MAAVDPAATARAVATLGEVAADVGPDGRQVRHELLVFAPIFHRPAAPGTAGKRHVKGLVHVRRGQSVGARMAWRAAGWLGILRGLPAREGGGLPLSRPSGLFEQLSQLRHARLERGHPAGQPLVLRAKIAVLRPEPAILSTQGLQLIRHALMTSPEPAKFQVFSLSSESMEPL